MGSSSAANAGWKAPGWGSGGRVPSGQASNVPVSWSELASTFGEVNVMSMSGWNGQVYFVVPSTETDHGEIAVRDRSLLRQ